MNLLSLLKLLEKIIFGGILLGLLVLYGAWQWEANTARSLLDNSIQDLQQGNVARNYRLTHEESLLGSIPDTRYRIVYQDQHFFWGLWYCISFADDTDLIIEIFPYLLNEHEVNIRQVPSCSSN